MVLSALIIYYSFLLLRIILTVDLFQIRFMCTRPLYLCSRT